MKTIGVWYKRVWAGLLVTALLFSMIPMTVFADASPADLLFEDDFSGTSDGWEPQNGTWVIENGVYKETSGASSGAMTFAGDTTWSDYEVEVTISNFNSSQYIMVCGRVQDAKNRYIASYTGSRLIIDRRINGVSTELAGISYKLPADTPVKMKFRCVGNQLSVYINDALTLEAADSTHATGKIGLATYKTAATFDDVTVRALTEELDVVSMPTTLSDYQVIQRDVTTQSAVLPVSGKVADNVASVDAAVLAYGNDSAVVDWTAMTVSEGIYTGSLTVPQGGWYQLAVRAKDVDGNELKNITDDIRFGVGINILCIGQSNMVGQGAAPYTEANDLVANFRNGIWSHLADPYDGVGASLVPAMANQLVEELGLPIGIIPAGDSGSGLHAKNPAMPSHGTNWYWMYYNESNPADTATLYGRALFRAQAAGGIELTVWNQGETDGYIQVPQDTYKADMVELLDRFRTDLGNATLPMFLCQIGPHVVKEGFDDAAYTAIRSAQNELDDGQNFFMTATEMDLPQKSDGIHYSTAGLNVIGQRVANGILYYYGKSTYYRGPYIASARFADTTKQVVDVEITHRGGSDITPATDITGFTVVAGDQEVTVSSTVQLDADTVRLTLSEALTADGYVRYLYGLVPDNTNVVKDNTALALPLEPTTNDIAIGGEPDAPVADDISFTTASGQIVYPVQRLMSNDRYEVSSDSVTVSSNVTAHATMPEGDAGCTYYAFATKTVGDYVEFTLPVTATGLYTVSVEGYGHSNRGTYQAYWNGNAFGGSYSQKISSSLDTQEVAGCIRTHVLGVVDVDTPGEVTVRFQSTVAGTIAFCNIILTPYTNDIDENGVVTYVFANMNKTSTVTPSVTETVTVDDTDMAFSPYPTVAGDTVAVTLPLKGVKPGAYALSVVVQKSNLRGNYSITPGDGLMATGFVDTAKAVKNSQWNSSKVVATHDFFNVLIDNQESMDLTFVAETGGVTGLGILAIKLTPIIGRYPIELLEFEQQTTTSQTPYQYDVSGDANYLLARMAKAGEYVEFTIPCVQPGLYQISATSYTDKQYRGTYQLYANGEAIGSPVSQTNTEGNVLRLDTLGNVVLTDVCDLKVRFEVTALGGGTGALALSDIQLLSQPVTVTFIGKYQETIVAKTVSSADELATVLSHTTAPALGGYRFTGWGDNANDYQLLFDAACQREDRLITVYAVYEEKPNAKDYSLTMGTAMTAVDGLSAAITEDTRLSFDQRIVATAQPVNEETVAYWLLDGAKTGFGQDTYTFYVSGHNDIRPVFVGEGETDPEPAVVLQQAMGAIGSDNHTLTVIAQTSIPDGYTLISCGVFYTGTAGTLTAVKAGTAEEGTYVQVVSSKTANQQYMTHLLNVQSGKTRYARAYAVVADVEGNPTTLWSSTVIQFKTTADRVDAVKGSID